MKINTKNLFLFFLTLILSLFIFNVKTLLASSLPFELRGHFLIQVDNHGQAWYVDTDNTLRHDISSEFLFFEMMKDVGLGISNSDLQKIPIAINDKLIEIDSDNDGLDDDLERAIGTDPYNSDSDGDSYNDKIEILNHFNPLGKGRLAIDKNFSSSLSGEILLQAESQGQAWYVSPLDNLRYYIGDYNDLIKIVSLSGRGINSLSLELITDSDVIKSGAIKNIKIDISKNQRLYYYLGDTEIGSFPISAGKATTPTPKGNFKIINKHLKAWSSYGLWMPYWMGLGTGSFGLHELPIWPSGYREGESHLGIPVSHGCIRLGIGPAKFLYDWANIGTSVLIY
ncbi:MAG: L,D-transpeptidase [Patescibacteria group bacterium]|nr:L,D-transpeptidase [Patescibacteria group bacterium]